MNCACRHWMHSGCLSFPREDRDDAKWCLELPKMMKDDSGLLSPVGGSTSGEFRLLHSGSHHDVVLSTA